MFISMRKLSIITGSLLLAVSTLSAEGAAEKTKPSLATQKFKAYDPDKYPYPMYKDETKAGKKVKTLYDGAIIKDTQFSVNNVYHSPLSANGFNRGEKAGADTLKAWNTDVRPDGKGLPEGKMTVEKGGEVYRAKCGTCHGDFGEGVDKFPVLAGGLGTLTLQPNSGAEPAPQKTVGSYAPSIAPFFWYIQTAMPLSSPKSLTNDEVYGILGYLLQVNETKVKGKDIADDTIVDAAFIKAVDMPNKDGFVYNDLRNPLDKNTRCMSNCIDEKKIKILRIGTDGTVVEPEFGEERWFYGEVAAHGAAAASPGQANYETYCAGCHASGIAGAYMLGDKKAWARVIAQGDAVVLKNAIGGKGAMPPKGGAMDLGDDKIKEIVDYMISQSK